MAISTTRKRKIIVNNITFYWRVKEEFIWLWQTAPKFVSVVSEDKKIHFKYEIDNFPKAYASHITILDQRPSQNKSSIKKQYLPSPKWENEDYSITPSNIHAMIEWCLSKLDDNPA